MLGNIFLGGLRRIAFCDVCLDSLTIIPQARIRSELIAHEAEGRMGY